MSGIRACSIAAKMRKRHSSLPAEFSLELCHLRFSMSKQSPKCGIEKYGQIRIRCTMDVGVLWYLQSRGFYIGPAVGMVCLFRLCGLCRVMTSDTESLVIIPILRACSEALKHHIRAYTRENQDKKSSNNLFQGWGNQMG
jgi:hypothetical protein